MDADSYEHYVKPELLVDFKESCHVNSTDFYSSGCVTTAHIVMKDLMQHELEGIWKGDKLTPKECWENGMRGNPGHSGASAAMTAIMIAKFSPRGEEFKKWCIKDDVVWVKWE